MKGFKSSMTTLHNTHSLARMASREELILQHEHLVWSVAREYATKGCRPDRADYIDRCEDLASYLLVELVAIVDECLQRGVQPVSTAGYLRTALEHCAVNYHRDGRDDILGRPEYQVKGYVVRRGDMVLSLDAIWDESGRGLQDVLEGNDASQGERDRDYSGLYAAIARLTEKRQEALGIRFGLAGWGGEDSLYAGGHGRGLSTNALYDRFYKAVQQLREDAQLVAWFEEREVCA